MVHCDICDVEVKCIDKHRGTVQHRRCQAAYEQGRATREEEVGRLKRSLEEFREKLKRIEGTRKHYNIEEELGRLKRSLREYECEIRHKDDNHARHLKFVKDVFQADVEDLRTEKNGVFIRYVEDAPKLKLMDFPVTKNNTKDAMVCSICQDKIHKKCDLVKTECNHRFHIMCILKWCDSKKTAHCPNCNAVVHRKSFEAGKL
eukprot:gene6223-2787_t